MPLPAGDKLGPYEILAQIGKGGMGEVYRARDARLGRDVAIKVSAERFSERFEREARTVASLNHPNICTLHDVGPNYLVMELVEGEAPKGPMPLDEAMRIMRQIADALMAAHDKGVVHRDLKPANIKIKPDGSVKVLDFGLAKVAPASAGESRAEDSPTLSMAATQAGQILGTAAYMAPEQAKGKPVDKRADIWAFAVVLYELLTGQRLFKGDDISEILAGVIKEKPDLSAVPAKVRPLLERCLAKDPKNRLRDIGDMELLLGEPRTASSPFGPASRLGTAAVTAAVVTTLALVVGTFIHSFEKPPAPPELMRFQVSGPAKTAVRKFQVSPDGKKIAFFGDSEGKGALWVRSLDALEATKVTDTDIDPPLFFWSSDSRYLAFGPNQGGSNRLVKVDVTGGAPEPICNVQNFVVGGSWSPDGTIIFGSYPGPIWRAPASGGTATPVTAVDSAKQDLSHFAPTFLPDGKHFLYLVQSNMPDRIGIYLGSLDAKPEQQSGKRLIAAGFAPAFLPTSDPGAGYVLFQREGTLMAQLLDLKKLELAGDPIKIATGLGSEYEFGGFSISTNGVLAYLPGGAGSNSPIQPTWFDQTKSLGPAMIPGVYFDMSLSRDGSQAALHRILYGGVSGDIWVMDFARKAFNRLTSEVSDEFDPVWSPDGSHIAYAAGRSAGGGIFQRAANGTGAEEVLLPPVQGLNLDLNDWSRDGRFLLYSELAPDRKYDLWVLPMTSEKPGEPRKASPYLNSTFSETQGQFSPDGHWIAYVSDETGRSEIYLQPFPLSAAPGIKYTVSNTGGFMPRFSRDGKQLFFVSNARTAMVADITYGSTLKISVPRMLFETGFAYSGPYSFSWDVAPDGKRFLLFKAVGDDNAPQTPLTVVLNWTSLLKK